MRMSRLPGRSLALGLACALLALPAPAFASGGPTPKPTPVFTSGSHGRAPSFSLTVSPTRLELPAGHANGSYAFQVVNRGGKAVDVTVGKSNFTTLASGALSFSSQAPYAAATWVDVTPKHFVLPPMTGEAVTMTVAVPPRADLGDHHVSLSFLVPAGRTQGNIRINRGIATPVLIAVPGPTSNDTELTWMHAPRFVLRGPVTVSAGLRDTGTVHRDFRGKGRLQVLAPGSDGTFADFTVLRGATRDVSTTWTPPIACVCHVRLAIPAAKGTTSTTSATVVVLPLDLMAVAILAILAAVLVARFRRRRYEGRVQAAAAAMQQFSSSGDA